MEKEEFNALITELGTIDDDVVRREKLTFLSESIISMFDNVKTITNNNEELKQTNEQLREANMKLFLKIGENKKSEDVARVEEEPKKKLNFDDLFNEKGELK